MGPSRDHRNLMKSGLGVLLLITLLQTGTEAQNCPDFLFGDIDENNIVGAEVITIPGGITLGSVPPGLPFTVSGNTIVATEVLDYETKTSYTWGTDCTPAGGGAIRIDIAVAVNNLNDNPPKFEKDHYALNVNEMERINKIVGTIPASDPDNLLSLIYTLTSASDAFVLKSSTVPEILVAKPLQYDDVKTVRLTLTVQDAIPPAVTHTDSTTIDITIIDVDNRPPWFQPCTEVAVEGVTICPSTGYRGTVNLGELELGPLPLIPNPILAIDGDKGINEPTRYSIISGDEGLFAIGAETGNITLVKAVDVTRTVHMTVMASQATNSHQFATTSLTMEVVIKSLHDPQFEKTLYEGTVEGVGAMAVETADHNQALKILATDQDYAAVGNINPYLVYSIPENTAFSIINGFLFMTTDVAAGSYNMEVKAVDTLNPQEVTTRLVVEVVKEPTTTAPPTTVTSPTPEPTTGITTVLTPASTVTTDQSPTPTSKPGPTSPNPDSTSPNSDSTSPNPDSTSPNPDSTSPNPDLTSPNPDSTSPNTGPASSNPTTPGPTGASVQTSNPALTTEGITTHTGGVINPPGGFTSADMAALGATLGVLLFICVVAVVVLAVKMRKGNSDWKKINEASAFRSSLGPSGQKQGVQFTNEAFQHDDDDKDDKGGPSGGGLGNGTVPSGSGTDKPQTRSIPRPPSPIQDDEKEVKPILSKDKSKEDGYKAVWFKEDIDPNAKEEVVIIPDSREEEEDEDSEEETKIPKVKFNDTDVDSGLGEKMEDSEEERAMTSSL